jgi:hypothetical protein
VLEEDFSGIASQVDPPEKQKETIEKAVQFVLAARTVQPTAMALVPYRHD